MGFATPINRNVFQTNKLLNNNTGYLILKEKHISIDTIELNECKKNI